MIKIPERIATKKAITQVMSEGKYVQITWLAYLRAYSNYAELFGNSQSASRLEERGGFGEEELDLFYPEWRNHIVK